MDAHDSFTELSGLVLIGDMPKAFSMAGLPEQRNQIYDEIDSRRENAILSTLNVIDPSTGQSYKVSNYSDYHWMNNSGVIAGNNTGDAPGPDCHQLVTCRSDDRRRDADRSKYVEAVR